MRCSAPVRLAVIAAIAIGLAAIATAPAAVPPATADAPDAAPFIEVKIDTVTPAVVTTSSEPVVTVVGRVINVGDRPVHDVVVRLERAAAVGTSAELRTPLRGQHDQFQPIGEFAPVTAELPRGEAAGFRVSTPLRSATAPALDIEQPGIYPLLVNVNGTPDYGTPARLDDARFLLPVAGVPASGGDATGASSREVKPDTANPVHLTMLWPLADRPRLVAGVAGGTVPVRLHDDELAASLVGGRLDTLLSTVEFATGAGADPGGGVARSLCLAVDPDLLVTVNAMTGGYVVGDAPAATHPGTGQAAAVGWLNRLRALAGRMCVTAIPYAQADLTALQRVGDPGLATIATSGAGQVVDQILGVSSVRGATPLSDGPLTRGAVDLLSSQADTVAIAAAPTSDRGLADQADATLPVDLTTRRLSPRVVIAPFDPAVGAALAAVGDGPVAPTYLDAPANRQLKQNLRHDSATARRQDALGSMLWRALHPPDTTAGPAASVSPVTPRTEILVPPATWALQPDDAHALLSTLATAIRSGLALPQSLPELIARSQTSATAPGVDDPALPDQVAQGRIDDAVTATIAEQSRRLWGLTVALTTDARTGLTGVGYTAPLREDMLRALSQAEPPRSRNALAHQRITTVGGTLDTMIGGVTVVNPGGSYTMATEHSPLPLALRNDLAVPIRVRLHLDAPPGMTVTDLGEIELPPGYLPLRVPIEVRLNQRVAVDAALSTPGGMALGESVRLSVHANAYGKWLFAITLSATAVLVGLAGRRLWHRFRGQPDRADLPEPGAPAPDAGTKPGRRG